MPLRFPGLFCLVLFVGTVVQPESASEAVAVVVRKWVMMEHIFVVEWIGKSVGFDAEVEVLVA